MSKKYLYFIDGKKIYKEIVMVYILIFNNGESYEDYKEYVAGIFKSNKKAKE